MNRFTTTRIVPHSAQQMFDLVADVERYPEFVPLCKRLRVRERTSDADGRDVVLARMTVAYKLLEESFVSRATLMPEEGSPQILVEYIDGPFRNLENRWTFHELANGSCEVEFFLAYEFKSRAFELLMGTMFDKAFRKFSAAFEARADEIYGRDGVMVGA